MSFLTPLQEWSRRNREFEAMRALAVERAAGRPKTAAEVRREQKAQSEARRRQEKKTAASERRKATTAARQSLMDW